MYLKIEMYAKEGLNNIGFSRIQLFDRNNSTIRLELSDLISHNFNNNTQGLLNWLNGVQSSTIPYRTNSSAEFIIRIPEPYVEYSFNFYNWLNASGLVDKVNIFFSEDGTNFYSIKEQRLDTEILSLTRVSVLAKRIYKKLILKNQVTNQYYSLAKKTLIILPDNSDKNMILHGVEAGLEIKLDEPFDTIRTVTENIDGTQTVIDNIVTPFSVYDYISENPEVLVYTESTDDITVSTTTEPYDLYDELNDELEVLYYTDDEPVTQADLILEANWSPIDELGGDFEVVTWTDEPQDTAQRVLEMTAIPKPQFVKMVQANSLINKIKEMDVIDRSYGYKNNTRFLLTDTYGINWYVWNKNVNNFTTINTTNDSLLDVGMTAEEINNITTDQWSLWNKDTVNVGIYMYDSPRDNIISEVEGISLQEDINKYTPELSNLLFYILNTTAKINVQLDGNVLKGEVSDDDLTRVQYRILLNGHPYFPSDGQFTPLDAPPVNIEVVITGDDVKIDENNILRVEFKDYFGTVDYWQTSFTGMYTGLIFKDIYGDYYSTEIGEILKYLDFGSIIAGQTTIEHEVLLKNQYGFDVSNLLLKADTSNFPAGLEIQFSKNQSPFVPESELNISNLENNTETPFFVRLKSQLGVTPVANGEFAISVKADKT